MILDPLRQKFLFLVYIFFQVYHNPFLDLLRIRSSGQTKKKRGKFIEQIELLQ